MLGEVLLVLAIGAIAAAIGVLIGRRVAPRLGRIAERMEDDGADE
ncbi:MAG TPA: hypothetical protein VEX41_05575 [Candidatus Eisenbacteria bacterium]|nr:hypothetical protein [Candidatus Eisenbacteria bacterium]